MGSLPQADLNAGPSPVVEVGSQLAEWPPAKDNLEIDPVPSSRGALPSQQECSRGWTGVGASALDDSNLLVRKIADLLRLHAGIGSNGNELRLASEQASRPAARQ